jgi:hypothetical protein
MSKAKKVKAIYSVMRNTAALDLFSSGELYESANALADLFGPSANAPSFEMRIGGRVFSEWATDVAMRNHPWQLVCEEHAVSDSYEYEDEHDFEVSERVKFLLEAC